MRCVLAAVALVLCWTSLAAADPAAGTREEAIAMVKRVQQKFVTAGPRNSQTLPDVGEIV